MPKDIKINNGLLDTDSTLRFAVSGTERMRIRSDGFISIGGTGAQAKVNIYGAAGLLETGINLYETSTGTNKRLYLYQETDRVVYDATFGSGGNAHAFNTGGTERVRITSAGNVGIGTNSPVSSLTIPTSTSTTLTASGTGMVSDSLGYTAVQFYEGGSTGGLRLISRHPSSANFSWIGFATGTGASATEKMRIDNAGNVGIGTNNPGDALVVTRSGDNTILSLQNYGSFVPVFRTNKANGTSASPTQVVSGNDLLRIGGTGYTSGGAFTADTVRITFQASENFTSTANGTAMLFSTVANGSTTLTERMRIDNAGNVGINITPNVWANVFQQRALQIGSVASLSVIDTGAGNVQTNLACNAYDFSSGPFYQVSAAASAYRQLSGSHVWYNAGTGTAGNTITFSERMRIDNAGNVGIGTANADASLVVARSGADSFIVAQQAGGFSSGFAGRLAKGTLASPTAVVSGDAITNFYAQGYNGSNYATSAYIRFSATQNFTASAQGTDIVFANCPNGSTSLIERMRIENSGRVGIATSGSSINATLTVNGSVAFKSIHAQAGTANVITATVTDHYIGVDTSSAAKTVTLPSPTSAGAGFMLVVKDESGAAGVRFITINPNASEKIDGASSLVINTNYGAVKLITNGTNWFVL